MAEKMESLARESRKNFPFCVSHHQASLSRSVSDPIHGYTQKPSASTKFGVVLRQDDAEQKMSTLPIPIPKGDRKLDRKTTESIAGSDGSTAGSPLISQLANPVQDQTIQSRSNLPNPPFAQLQGMAPDRLYLLMRFLEEQHLSSQDVINMTTEALAKRFEDETAPARGSQNQSGSSLETDLLMIGGFAADFKEWLALKFMIVSLQLTWL